MAALHGQRGEDQKQRHVEAAAHRRVRGGEGREGRLPATISHTSLPSQNGVIEFRAWLPVDVVARHERGEDFPPRSRSPRARSSPSQNRQINANEGVLSPAIGLVTTCSYAAASGQEPTTVLLCRLPAAGPAPRLEPVRAKALGAWPARQVFDCNHAGLYLLLPAMAELGLDELVAEAGYPKTKVLGSFAGRSSPSPTTGNASRGQIRGFCASTPSSPPTPPWTSSPPGASRS
jgi:hypothetical protein